ncbi:MAG: diaminobutyrate--2-oxoglutarate transaminase [Hyphomicrobiaceae bacterium]
MKVQAFEKHEAQVRSYCRSFPAVFESGLGATLKDEDGNHFTDFLAGAGTLNYGHNNPSIKTAVMEYLARDGVIHALDMYTVAKRSFIEVLNEVILEPRGLDYKVTFPAPTGTNAVETAMKIARRATGRQNIIAFTNGFHGMTAGALAASATRRKREGAGVTLSGVTRMPYEGYANGLDSAALLDQMLSDDGGGIDAPAAIIVETVQAEGGLNAASAEWLRAIASIAAKHGALLIVDDIQTGCGRTGTFFSFESMGFTPDIICLSKAIGGMGLPMALVLFRPALDVLAPGEHNGTFRGHNLAFVAATAALQFWRDPAFGESIRRRGRHMQERLGAIVARHPYEGAHVRGRGMLLGIGWNDAAIAGEVSQEAFRYGVIAETTGSSDQVLKFLPPLIISDEELMRGLDGIELAIAAVMKSRGASASLTAAE